MTFCFIMRCVTIDIYHPSLILSYKMLTFSLVITAFQKLLINRTFLLCVSKLFFRVECELDLL
jgi:hypothetical protein